MHQRANCLVVFLVLSGTIVALVADAETHAKLAPPTTSAVNYSQGLIRQGYADDFTAAKESSQKLDLAKKLIGALDTEKDPSMRFALLSSARDLSSDAGDYPSAADAIDQLAKEFDIDTLKMKCDAAAVCAKKISQPQPRKDFLASADDLFAQTLAADRFDLAKSMLDQLKAVGREIDTADIQKHLLVVAQQLKDSDAAYHDVQKLQPILKSKPNDPDANLKLGRYRCFLKGDWVNGLANLSHGSDPAIKALADSELAAGSLSPDDQVKLADGWWALGDKEKDTARAQLERHAVAIYQQAVSQLGGLTKARIEKRIASIGPLLVVKPRVVVDPAVTAEIQKTVDAIMKAEDATGNWDAKDDVGEYSYGRQTAAACFGLLTAGQDPAKNDKLRAGLDCLAGMHLLGIYPLSSRIRAMDILNSPAGRVVIKGDLDTLLRAQKANGLFADEVEMESYTNVNATLCGALGYAAAAHQGFQIPEQRWAVIADALLRRQASNGGFSFGNEPGTQTGKPADDGQVQLAPTFEGVSALCLARDHITNEDQQDIIGKAIDRAVAYLDKKVGARDMEATWDLMNVQDAGLLTSHRTFSDVDWYKVGCDALQRLSDRADILTQSSKLIFLSRGTAN